MHSPDIQSTSLQYALRGRLLDLVRRGNLAPNQAEGLEVFAALCRPLYIPILEERDPNKLDRTSSFFFGFSWTSEQFPWPDRCAEPCIGESLLHAPLVQLNLDQIGKSIGENVGSGLFQVFLPLNYDEGCFGRDGNGVGACIRTIPAREVNRHHDMTPFPLEGKSPLEACKYWNMDGVPNSYNDLEEEFFWQNENSWTVYRLETILTDKGFPSDGYEIGPALAIVDWVPHIPRAHIEVSRLSDKSLKSLFARWDPLADTDPEIYTVNREIIAELFFHECFPRPALFGWPRADNATGHAINARRMPLIVFDGIHEDLAGDWLDVFEDIAFWTHGYYL